MAQIIQMNENTYRFEDGFVRFFLLIGDNKAVLIDSGASCNNALELAKTITDKDIFLLNTHGDIDHLSGTASFSEIYMHASDYNNCDVKSKFPSTSLVEINDNDIIDLGNRPLKIIYIPGHTRGSVAILDISHRTLFAGDSVQKGHIYMFGAHRDIDSYEASLDKIIAIENEFDNIIASHDEYQLSKDYARKVKEAWLDVRNGKVSYETINLFGNEIKSYTLSTCGFYMQ